MYDWQRFEREHVWHPYTSMLQPMPVYAVRRAEGAWLELEDGRRLIDGMASWWCAIHGYQVPELNAVLQAQSEKMAHVMFGGLTHRPAADLARQLMTLAPGNMQHVFFADSGSVAVEVALKMALQYWQAQGQVAKHRFLTIRHGYHGDTFGAMSVCDPVSGMHQMFASFLSQQLFANAPTARNDAEWNDTQMNSFRELMARHHRELAAVILEPIVQGAGGMRFYAPEFLRQVRQLCDAYDVLLIVDEIATGFGRTGKMFACEHAAVAPDIVCLGKALTGGYMSLAATLTTSRVCQGIHADGQGVLMHGPTFMANPLACAVAGASIELLLDSPWQRRVHHIEQYLCERLAPCRAHAAVRDVRVLGAIGVVEMKRSIDVARVQQRLVARGVWLRPFGRLLYAMPPYILDDAQLDTLTSAMCAVLDDV